MATVALRWATLTTANTAKDGTGTVGVIHNEPVEMYIDRVVFRALGTNVATVARLFINNGDPNSDAAANALFDEITLPATTLDETAALTEQIITTDLWLPANYRLLVTLGTTVVAGYRVTAGAGPYYTGAFA